MNVTVSGTSPFSLAISNGKNGFNPNPLQPLGFSKVEWLKSYCYLTLRGIIKIYELCVKIFTDSLFFLSPQTKQPLHKHIRAVELQGVYLKWQMNCIQNRWKYQGYLVQTTLNSARLDVLNSEEDLKVAKELLDRERSEFVKKGKNTFLKHHEKGERLDELKKMSKINPDIVETLRTKAFESFAEAIFADANALKQPYSGVCAAAVLSSASQRLLNNTTWDDIANNMHEGVDAIVSGAQISMPKLHNNTILAKIFQVQLVDMPLINKDKEDVENFEEISKLSEGIYFLSLDTRNSQKNGKHAILYCREADKVIILDPNVGLLCCDPDEAQTLITKTLEVYPLPDNSESHNINVCKIIPLEQYDDFWEKFIERAASENEILHW